jgi:hypothetical protein
VSLDPVRRGSRTANAAQIGSCGVLVVACASEVGALSQREKRTCQIRGRGLFHGIRLNFLMISTRAGAGMHIGWRSRSAREAIVRRRVRPVAFRQIAPRHPGAQHVKYRVHDLSIVSAGTHSALRHQRLKKSPFVIPQIKSHDPTPITVNHDHYDFSRSYLGTDPRMIRC